MLQLDFSFQAVTIAADRGHRRRPTIADISDRAVVGLERAVNPNLIPVFGVTGVPDRDVVMLTPEEGHGVEPFATAQHVACGDLTLTLGNDPVLDANSFAAVGVWPACDIASGEDAGRTRLQVLVHCDSAVQGEASLFGERCRRPDTDAHDEKIGVECGTSAQLHRPAIDGRHGLTEVKDDTLLLMQSSHEPAYFRAHDALEGRALRRDDVDRNAARAQRRSNLEADEARPRDSHMFGVAGPLDDAAAIGKRSQIHQPAVICARQCQSHGIGASRKEQSSVRTVGPILQMNGPPRRIDRHHPAVEQKLDVML